MNLNKLFRPSIQPSNHPSIRSCRFIAHTADLSALIRIKKSYTKGAPPWMKGVPLLLTCFHLGRDFQKNLRCPFTVTLSRSEGSLLLGLEMLRCSQHDSAILLSRHLYLRSFRLLSSLLALSLGFLISQSALLPTARFH